MQYEEFKGALIECLADHAGEGAEVQSFVLQRNNSGYREGLCVKQPGRNISPSICIHDYYEEGYEPEEVAAIYRERLSVSEIPEAIRHVDFLDYSSICSRLSCRLINAAANRTTLENSPHRLYGEFALMYHIQLSESEDEMMSCLVTDALARQWDRTEKELFAKAMRNLPCLNPTRVCPLAEMLPGYPAEHDPRLLFLGNVRGQYGAANLMLPDSLRTAAALCGGDFWVLPASIHEFILVADDGELNEAYLREMVRSINRSAVAPEDVLGEQIAFYHAKEELLTWSGGSLDL